MSQRPIEELLGLMAALRDREKGCPWDIEQTFNSLIPHTLEEAYEVADCIEREDYEALPAELGDLLLQIVFYTQIASESNLFDFDRVVDEICRKLVARHPHVFAQPESLSAEQQTVRWETMKARERQGNDEDKSALASIALNLPALVRAQKLQKRAARVGFDWSEERNVRAKVREEFDELVEACEGGEQAAIAEEFGDLLFSCVNWGRFLGLDAESALRAASQKFENRFRALEAKLAEEGLDIERQSLASLDARWESVKLDQKKRAP